MNALKSLSILADVCAMQKGMFTTAQAARLGVGKMDVSRLAKYGYIERIMRGVYRSSAAPSTREEDVYAAWLSLEPNAYAFERSSWNSDFIISLNTAAWLQLLGELRAVPLVFSHHTRRQTRSNDIHFLKRTLLDEDIAIIAGMPVTTPRKTILDLIEHGEDLSLVASVVRDAESSGALAGIEHDINLLAEQCGFPNGFDLYGYMMGACDGESIRNTSGF